MFGKWHLGDSPGRYPTDQGFDEWYGVPNSTDESYWPDNDLCQISPPRELDDGREYQHSHSRRCRYGR